MYEINKNKPIGYRLINKGSGFWSIEAPDEIFTGNLKEVCLYAVSNFDFELKELEYGISEMEKNWHNAAEYGSLLTFMWTYDTEDKLLKTGGN